MTTPADLISRLRSEAREVYQWSNGPSDQYGVHSHAYTKVLYCLEGSIDFIVEPERRRIHLAAGDRMELPAGTPHSAVVGTRGVVCAEGKKPAE
jgi:quercetin dioxygenase-like cupin family protein